MAERKAVIKNADMSEDMQQDAVDCASQSLEKYNIEKARRSPRICSRIVSPERVGSHGGAHHPPPPHSAGAAAPSPTCRRPRPDRSCVAFPRASLIPPPPFLDPYARHRVPGTPEGPPAVSAARCCRAHEGPPEFLPSPFPPCLGRLASYIGPLFGARRTSRRSSRRSLTGSTTRRGTVSSGATSVRMSHTKRSTSSTSTSARWPSCCSSRVRAGRAGLGRDNADMPLRLGVVMQCSVYSLRAHHGEGPSTILRAHATACATGLCTVRPPVAVCAFTVITCHW